MSERQGKYRGRRCAIPVNLGVFPAEWRVSGKFRWRRVRVKLRPPPPSLRSVDVPHWRHQNLRVSAVFRRIGGVRRLPETVLVAFSTRIRQKVSVGQFRVPIFEWLRRSWSRPSVGKAKNASLLAPIQGQFPDAPEASCRQISWLVACHDCLDDVGG